MSSTNTYIITEHQRLNFKPTFLYIKEHAITGLRYFGETTKSDPIKYPGSGTRWQRHYKVHGKEHVNTIWYHLFDNIDLLVEFALFFSEEYDIVESDNWANLTLENGLDGASVGHKVSKETAKKISEAQKEIPKSIEHKRKISSSLTGRKLEQNRKDNISKSLIGKPKSKIHARNSGIAHRKIYQVTNPEGDSFIVTCMVEFCQKNNLTTIKMYNVACGTRLHHKGWKCCKFDN